MGKPLGWMAINESVGKLPSPSLQPIPYVLKTRDSSVIFIHCKLDRSRKSRVPAGRSLSPGASLSFLSPTLKYAFEFNSLSNHQRADSFGTIDLVAEKEAASTPRSCRFSGTYRAIGQHRCVSGPPFVNHSNDLSDGRNRSHFVIHVHNGNKTCRRFRHSATCPAFTLPYSSTGIQVTSNPSFSSPSNGQDQHDARHSS